MKKNPIILCLVALLAVAFTSCLKVIPKFNSNNLTVTFSAPTATYLTTDRTVNAKDSLDFSYSVVSTLPMTYLSFQKNSTELYRDSIKGGNMLTATGLKKFIADTIPGQYVFQVVAKDNDGVYIGSSNPIVVTVNSNFNYHTNLRLYAPDTANKTNKCFINLATGTTYSYSDVMTGGLSAQVDLGYFFSTDTINTATSATAAQIHTAVGHTFYAPSSIPVASQRTFYDLSTWTKNATQIQVATTPTFANLLSTGAIKNGAIAALAKPVVSLPVYTPGLVFQGSTFKALAAGNVIFFKTVAGNYGAIQIDYVSAANANQTTYVNFEYKITQ